MVPRGSTLAVSEGRFGGLSLVRFDVGSRGLLKGKVGDGKKVNVGNIMMVKVGDLGLLMTDTVSSLVRSKAGGLGILTTG